MDSQSQETIFNLMERVTTKQQELSHVENKYHSKLHIKRSIIHEIESLTQLYHELYQDRQEIRDRNQEISNQVNSLRHELEHIKQSHSDLNITNESLCKTMVELKFKNTKKNEYYQQKHLERSEMLKDLQQSYEKLL